MLVIYRSWIDPCDACNIEVAEQGGAYHKHGYEYSMHMHTAETTVYLVSQMFYDLAPGSTVQVPPRLYKETRQVGRATAGCGMTRGDRRFRKSQAECKGVRRYGSGVTLHVPARFMLHRCDHVLGTAGTCRSDV